MARQAGYRDPLELAHFSGCLEYPGPWLLAAFPPPRTVPPLAGQILLEGRRTNPGQPQQLFQWLHGEGGFRHSFRWGLQPGH